MANDIFNPQVATLQSSTTPTQGVSKADAVSLFADVAEVAAEGTVSYLGHKELSKLSGSFDEVVQLRKAGKGKAPTLQAKADAMLSKYKLANPTMARQADALYREKFGGGTFEKTPEEVSQENYRRRVADLVNMLGLEPEQAAGRVAQLEKADQSKKLAEQQKLVREYNGELVYNNTEQQVTVRSIIFMDDLQARIKAGSGSLSHEDTRSLKLSISQQAAKLKQELASQARDPATNHLLMGTAEYDKSVKAIEEWETKSRAMLDDNDYLNLITKLNTAKSAEVNYTAMKNFETISILKASGGEPAVQAYLEATRRGEGAAVEFLKRTNPHLANLFGQGGSFLRSADMGLNKLTLGMKDGEKISEQEAVATGHLLNDPANFPILAGIIKSAKEFPDKLKAWSEIVKKNPQAAAVNWSERYKAFAQANPEQAKLMNNTTLEALRTAFITGYASENSSLDIDFSFGNVKEGVAAKDQLRGGYAKALASRFVTGEGISPETASIARDVRSLFSQVPDALSEISKKAGADLTPEEATRFYLTNKLPERLTMGSQESRELNADTPDEFSDEFDMPKEKAPAPAAKEKAPKGTPKEKPLEATGTPDELRIKGLMDSGIGKEQMIQMLDALGLAEPAYKRMKGIIENVS